MSPDPTKPVSKISSKNLNRHVAQYSLAAAVAGVSMLALVQPAAGEVVVTKKTIPIPLAPRSVPEPVGVSLANNGVNDFNFELQDNASNHPSSRFLTVGAANPGNKVLVTGSFYGKALALPRGATIGPKVPPSAGCSSFPLVEGSDTSTVRSFRGEWGGNPQNRYLGVQFLIKGQIHYGWIRLTVTTSPQPHTPVMSARLTGYAYETVPNKPIVTGTAATATAEIPVPDNIQKQSEPSLGTLALGAEGIPMWRREESSVRQ
jgi:hypothetical protein